MAAALLRPLCPLFSIYPSSSSSSSSSSSKPPLFSSSSVHFPLLCRPFIGNSLHPPNRRSNGLCFQLCCCVVQEETAAVVETKTKQTQQEANSQKRKLYVLNMPWSLSVSNIKDLFGQCGTVSDVEIIKQKDGKNRSFAFVTMASGEEAQAVIDKFNSQEVSGRIITVEYAKRLKRPSPPGPSAATGGETRHKLYVSNLAWKARSSHLREFFSNFNPVSSRVVFENPSGRSAGYGFVSFSTREEAEAAISALNGKELMGRAVHLKFSERKDDQSGSEMQEEEKSDGQLEE